MPADPLELLAHRALTEPFFLASVLAAYSEGERLDDPGLASALGCAVEDLLMLRLCQAPRDDAPGFRDDIVCIAQRFHLDSSRLATIVKRGRVLARLRRALPAEGGFLMAARDREDDPPTGEDAP